MSPVIFRESQLSEREFFEEYNKHSTGNCWFLLIYILRSFAPLCLAVQVEVFEYPGSVDIYIDEFSINLNSSHRFANNNSTEQGYTRLQSFKREASQKNLVLRMSVFKSIGLCLGALIGGLFADLYGRRMVSFYSCIVWNILGWIWILIHNKHVLELAFVVAVAFCNIVNVVTFVTFGEITTKMSRLLVIYTIPYYLLGVLVLDYTSKAIHVWQYLIGFIASTNCIMIFACWYTPESARWLINKNKIKEAFQVLNEISGKLYTLPEQQEENVKLKKTTITYQMMLFLFTNKLKHFLIICLSMVIASLNYNFAKLRAVIHYVDTDEFGLLSIGAEAIGYLFIIPVYIFLGKTHGLFFIYILLSLAAVVALITHEFGREIYYNTFCILFGTTAVCLNWLIFLDLFPTFLRATTMGCSFFIFGLAIALSSLLVHKVEEYRECYFYVTFFLTALFGVTVLALPRSHSQNLPNYKLN